MSIDVTFDQGSWWYKTRDLDFCLTSEPSRNDLRLLASLVEHRNSLVSAADTFARQSACAADIDDCGGMTPSMIVVPADHRFIIWFQLADSERFLGVRFADDHPIDIYVDHP